MKIYLVLVSVFQPQNGNLAAQSRGGEMSTVSKLGGEMSKKKCPGWTVDVIITLSYNPKGTMPGARRRGRPRTAWMDDIKTWTGLPVEESVREDMDK